MHVMPVSRSARLLAALALPLLVAACSVSGGPAAVDTPSPSASAHATAGASPGPASSGAAATALGSPGATPASSAMLGPTTGTLTLVEPARDLSSSQGSVTLTPPGSLAMLQAGADGRLHTLACAVGCGDPAVWSDTVLDPGVGWANPMIRSLDDGSLVAVMDGTGSAQGSEVIGECASACDSAASWR